MKRKEMIKTLKDMGCVLIRHGGKHEWCYNPQTKISRLVPRHNEINEYLARHIIKNSQRQRMINLPIRTTIGILIHLMLSVVFNS